MVLFWILENNDGRGKRFIRNDFEFVFFFFFLNILTKF